MVKYLLTLALATQAFAADKDVIIACRSKTPGTHTYQVYGLVGESKLKVDKFVQIDVWDESKAPVVKQNEIFEADSTYRPRDAKYKNLFRYKIQENTSTQYQIHLLLPTKDFIWKQAREKMKKDNRDMVQVYFSGILRFRDDFNDDTGGQEILDCNTGWMDK